MTARFTDTEYPGGFFRDGYRGLSSIQPDLQAVPAEGIMVTGEGQEPRARCERDRSTNSHTAGQAAPAVSPAGNVPPDIPAGRASISDISAASWGWSQWMRYRNG